MRQANAAEDVEKARAKSDARIQVAAAAAMNANLGVNEPARGATGSGSGLAMRSERPAQIARMESMGFERSQIDDAMRAAFYSSERAIEYLLTVSSSNTL